MVPTRHFSIYEVFYRKKWISYITKMLHFIKNFIKNQNFIQKKYLGTIFSMYEIFSIRKMNFWYQKMFCFLLNKNKNFIIKMVLGTIFSTYGVFSLRKMLLFIKNQILYKKGTYPPVFSTFEVFYIRKMNFWYQKMFIFIKGFIKNKILLKKVVSTHYL